MDWAAVLAILAQVDWFQVAIVVLSILFFISELLGNIPQIKANSIYQLVIEYLPKIIDAIKKIKKPGKTGSDKPKKDEEITQDQG